MTDYKKTTGSTGTMMIRDLGSVVEFWFKAGYTNDYWNGLKFNTTANGSTVEVSINYPQGADWKRVATRTVNESQTVTFRLLTSTGTQGMGGPTTFSVFLDRGSTPAAPSKPVISNITDSSVYVTFSDGDNGGLAIDARQIGFGSSSTYVSKTVSSDRSTTITGLARGTRYYFWARTHNAKGWGPWSPYTSARTLDVPDPPSIVTLTNKTQVSVDASFTVNYNGGTGIIENQIGYGTSPTSVQQTVSSRIATITGLEPGLTYYFWARSRNAIGWSAWGPRNHIGTIAAARIKIGTVWKLAVPYVKHNGVWKVARPWVRRLGVWKETI